MPASRFLALTGLVVVAIGVGILIGVEFGYESDPDWQAIGAGITLLAVLVALTPILRDWRRREQRERRARAQAASLLKNLSVLLEARCDNPLQQTIEQPFGDEEASIIAELTVVTSQIETLSAGRYRLLLTALTGARTLLILRPLPGESPASYSRVSKLLRDAIDTLEER